MLLPRERLTTSRVLSSNRLFEMGFSFRHRNMSTRAGGFTIIELLVSSAVLALLVTALAATFSNFIGFTSSSGKRLENNNQMRTIFDRMSFDLSSSVRNGGLEVIFSKNAQARGGGSTLNDSMIFFTDARTAHDSRLARVAYEVDQGGNAATGVQFSSLFRGVDPFNWSDNPGSTTMSTMTDWQELGRGIFRMELSFLKTDGSLVGAAPDQDEIAAVICSTASLDESSLSKLSVGERSLLISALPDAQNDELPLSKWSADQLAGLPPFVRQNVRFSQRQFYLK